MMNQKNNRIRSTTILAVSRNGQTALAGDGQVTLSNMVLKSNANKIRTMNQGRVLTGFAGSTADAFTLFEKFEGKLKEYNNNLMRAAVELGKDWRTDRILRKLEALLLVADKEHIFTLSGNGDVIEADSGIAAIGSGGSYALAAARALCENTDLSAKDIVTKSMHIAGDICIYTNNNIHVEVLEK